MRKANCDFSKIISKSFDRSLLILFKPFSIKKWLILLFIAWLAGALGGSSTGNFNVGDFDQAKDAEAYPVREANIYQKEGTPLVDSIDQLPEFSIEGLQPDPSDPSVQESEFSEFAQGDQEPIEGQNGSVGLSPKEIAIMVAIGLVVGLPFMLLFSWLCARFKFIWYEAIVQNQTLVAEPFTNYKKEGNSLFVFFILYGILGWICLIALGAYSYFLARGAGAFESGFTWSFSVFLGLFGWQILLFILMVIVGLIAIFIIDHFLVPIMAIDRIPFSQGIQKFFQVFKENQKDFWLFLLLNIGLSMLCGILSLIAVIMIILILALAALIIFGFLYLLTVVLFKLKVVFAILAVILGIPFIAMVILLLTAVSLPMAVFFRHLSLHFLSSLQCGYSPLPLDD